MLQSRSNSDQRVYILGDQNRLQNPNSYIIKTGQENKQISNASFKYFIWLKLQLESKDTVKQNLRFWIRELKREICCTSGPPFGIWVNVGGWRFEVPLYNGILLPKLYVICTLLSRQTLFPIFLPSAGYCSLLPKVTIFVQDFSWN